MKSIKEFMSMKKKGMGLGDLWPAFTLIAGIVVLVIVLLVLFGSDGLGGFFDPGSAEANATATARDKFIAVLPLILLVPLILVLAVIISVVIGSFWFGGSKRA